MSLVLLGTTSHALTSTPYTFQPDAGVADSNPLNTPQSWRVRAWSDQPFHIAVNSGDASTNDCPVSGEWHGITVVIPPGGTLSTIKQAGATDSSIWFSRVKTA
jgi:hypothetical protein